MILKKDKKHNRADLNIAFNTANTNRPIGMYFMMYPKVWINYEIMPLRYPEDIFWASENLLVFGDVRLLAAYGYNLFN